MALGQGLHAPKPSFFLMFAIKIGSEKNIKNYGEDFMSQ